MWCVCDMHERLCYALDRGALIYIGKSSFMYTLLKEQFRLHKYETTESDWNGIHRGYYYSDITIGVSWRFRSLSRVTISEITPTKHPRGYKLCLFLWIFKFIQSGWLYIDYRRRSIWLLCGVFLSPSCLHIMTSNWGNTNDTPCILSQIPDKICWPLLRCAGCAGYKLATFSIACSFVLRYARADERGPCGSSAFILFCCTPFLRGIQMGMDVGTGMPLRRSSFS